MHESKEKIKSRMIKNASRLWGYTDTEPENSFDPLVGLIIGSLANELEKVSSQIDESGTRILEKLVQMLTPEPLTGIIPAHGVISANPIPPQFEIFPDYQFYLYKKTIGAKDSARKEDKIIFFTPAGYFNLFKGNARFLAVDKKIFEIQQKQYKEVFCQASRGNGLNPAEIWIGLEFDEEITSIDGLSFYFDLKSGLRQETFFQSLGRSKWTINGHPVSFSQGYSQGIEGMRKEIDALTNQELDITAKILIHVNLFYRKKFMSWKSGESSLAKLWSKDPYPSEFGPIFPQRELEKIPRGLFWARVELPQPLSPETMEDLYCSINCFPAINRQMNDFSYTSRELLNIIPLQTEDSFLDIHKVTNSEGKVYSMKALSPISAMTEGSFILRHGNIGRFDSRNAKEVLNHIIELLRDESAAFSLLGTDMVSTSIKELHQIISRIEQRLSEYSGPLENTSYLMLKSFPKDEMVFVKFWSTSGTVANNLKAGNILFPYEGTDLAQDSILFIAGTKGGRERMDSEERINA